MEIIEIIEKIMKEKGITAYMLEKDIGIKQATFQGWKRGSQPAANKLSSIIKYLDVTPNEIFGYESAYMRKDEKELILNFRKLSKIEKIKFIGRIECAVKKIKKNQENIRYGQIISFKNK